MLSKLVQTAANQIRSFFSEKEELDKNSQAQTLDEGLSSEDLAKQISQFKDALDSSQLDKEWLKTELTKTNNSIHSLMQDDSPSHDALVLLSAKFIALENYRKNQEPPKAELLLEQAHLHADQLLKTKPPITKDEEIATTQSQDLTHKDTPKEYKLELSEAAKRFLEGKGLPSSINLSKRNPNLRAKFLNAIHPDKTRTLDSNLRGELNALIPHIKDMGRSTTELETSATNMQVRDRERLAIMDTPSKGPQAASNSSDTPSTTSEEEREKLAKAAELEKQKQAREEEIQKEREAKALKSTIPQIAIADKAHKETATVPDNDYNTMLKKYPHNHPSYLKPEILENKLHFHISEQDKTSGSIVMESASDGKLLWHAQGDIKAPKVITIHDDQGNLREAITINAAGNITEYKAWDEKHQPHHDPSKSTKFNAEFLKNKIEKGKETQKDMSNSNPLHPVSVSVMKAKNHANPLLNPSNPNAKQQEILTRSLN